jgi:hypothetical protein
MFCYRILSKIKNITINFSKVLNFKSFDFEQNFFENILKYYEENNIKKSKKF